MMHKQRKWLGLSALALAAVQSLPAHAQTPAPRAPAAPTPNPLLAKQAPKGAPNVLLILLDDVGFGSASTFGGAAVTPTMDGLARDGLRYNRFHTAAICSPTRSSLLTGRNPHATGIGSVMNGADSRPGYSGVHGKDTGTIAEILRQNGYNTAAFGKWHQTPDWEVSQSGPFDRWPTGEGFERFYGFQGGETNQFEPTLFDGTRPIMRPAGKDYHLSQDMADQSIAWLRNQHAVTPEKPFFLYFATGGIHAPIQVPQKWADRYRGKFDGGWDKLREQVFARQKTLGVIPAKAVLTPRPADLPAWDSLSPEQKVFSARLMESYAGFLAHTDEQVGRVVQQLKDSGQYDNTLIIYVVGDNGASLEGGPNGSLNYLGGLIGLPEPEPAKLARIGEIGSQTVHSHINASWAWANNTPFQWGKQMPGYLGAMRNPLIVTWPKGIKDKGGLRSQFGHVNDIAPTILEATGIAAPATLDGVSQKPMNGTSLAYSFTDARAPERHRTQYFEVFGRRAIYHDGWIASAYHGSLPWIVGRPETPLEQDRWELYDLRSDFSQGTDLAGREPARLEALQQLFLKEAEANQALPLGGMRFTNRGLPDLAANVTTVTYPAGTEGVPETALPHMANRSWTVSADLSATDSSQGVIAAVGGTSAGWSLYLDADRHAVFRYRVFDVKTVELRTADPIPSGARKLKVDFDYDGGGWARGGTFKLSLDGAQKATDRVPATSPAMFTIDETFDVGLDRGSPAGVYPPADVPGFAFRNGDIRGVTISLR